MKLQILKEGGNPTRARPLRIHIHAVPRLHHSSPVCRVRICPHNQFGGRRIVERTTDRASRSCPDRFYRFIHCPRQPAEPRAESFLCFYRVFHGRFLRPGFVPGRTAGLFQFPQERTRYSDARKERAIAFTIPLRETRHEVSKKYEKFLDEHVVEPAHSGAFSSTAMPCDLLGRRAAREPLLSLSRLPGGGNKLIIAIA